MVQGKWEEMFGEKEEETVEDMKVKKPWKKTVTKKKETSKKALSGKAKASEKKTASKETIRSKVVKVTSKTPAKKQ